MHKKFNPQIKEMELEYYTYDGEGNLVWAPSGRRLTESEIQEIKKRDEHLLHQSKEQAQ